MECKFSLKEETQATHRPHQSQINPSSHTDRDLEKQVTRKEELAVKRDGTYASYRSMLQQANEPYGLPQIDNPARQLARLMKKGPRCRHTQALGTQQK